MSKKYTREDIAAKYGEDFLNALGNKHDREISERWGMPRGTIYSMGSVPHSVQRYTGASGYTCSNLWLMSGIAVLVFAVSSALAGD